MALTLHVLTPMAITVVADTIMVMVIGRITRMPNRPSETALRRCLDWVRISIIKEPPHIGVHVTWMPGLVWKWIREADRSTRCKRRSDEENESRQRQYYGLHNISLYQ
ncbi:hypothetical protein BD410DRAFT_779728 [Rickenella mellea]|uniref:Uncharacterized protein n=1 Tax=Rickenella mellea TaxID=50990 RepID=A0A4R5XE18_9AGAM|nr:hypothetical protein BD410DRAFT_779728 [Rickenella mellea]